MKKRTVIAIIITIITIIATNKYWFVIRPMSVNFDILGHGACNIEVQLNNKDDDEFKKVKSKSIYINLDEKKHADVLINRAKSPKRIKFIVSNLSSDKPITISNIRFGDGRFSLGNIEKFKADGAKIVNKNSKLTFIPNNDVITFIYPDTLQVRPRIDFDFLMFTIILILTYLLAYKLSNYVAEFNTIKGKPKVEVIFLTIFFIFLLVPMMHMNKDDISLRENRTLAKWKPLILQDNTINFEFGNNFNEWFNDRFNLRDMMVEQSELRLLLQLNQITKDVIKGKDGWLFLGWKQSIDSYSNKAQLTKMELSKITNYLISIDNYCKKHNKKFYFIIAPDKSKIYGEFYNDSIKQISLQSKTEQLINYLNKYSKVKVIYPQKQIIEHKGEQLLYYKNDTHWNLLGAYYAYIELMKRIKEDYNIQTYAIKGYITEKYNGDLYDMSPRLLRKSDDTIYAIPNIENYNSICKLSNEPRGIVNCFNRLGRYNLLMFRDSFSTSLIPYLSNSFKLSKYIWTYNVSPLAMENADVIILEIVERNIPTLINSHME